MEIYFNAKNLWSYASIQMSWIRYSIEIFAKYKTRLKRLNSIVRHSKNILRPLFASQGLHSMVIVFKSLCNRLESEIWRDVRCWVRWSRVTKTRLNYKLFNEFQVFSSKSRFGRKSYKTVELQLKEWSVVSKQFWVYHWFTGSSAISDTTGFESNELTNKRLHW